jgi:predicted TIM-barrel fold metal-dependent hydrolase
VINDAHCHFFSQTFFQALAKDTSRVYRELQWDDPGEPDALADRWVREMDANGVHRAALIASVPGDAASVAAAVARHPARIVGFFMVDPSAADAPARTRRALTEERLTTACLFPAMHHVPLDDDRTLRVVEAAAACPGAAVFVHCGRLSVGVRDRLGLPSRFDLALGDPIALSRLARAFPAVPFIVPHFGAGRFQDALGAVDACANVHLDTSSSNSWISETPGLTLAAVFKDALAAAGASRLLFGTDSSFFPRGWQRGIYEHQNAILDQLRVSDEDKALIFGGNFERLFPRRQSSETSHRQT